MSVALIKLPSGEWLNVDDISYIDEGVVFEGGVVTNIHLKSSDYSLSVDKTAEETVDFISRQINASFGATERRILDF